MKQMFELKRMYKHGGLDVHKFYYGSSEAVEDV